MLLDFSGFSVLKVILYDKKVTEQSRSMESTTHFNQFFQHIQRITKPGLWSKGSTIAKALVVIERQQSESELHFSIQERTKVASPQVQLWPEEEDYFCDCGSDFEPCEHIAACVIAVKNNWVQKPKPQGDIRASTRVWNVEYHFSCTEHQELFFERKLFSGQDYKTLNQSLVGFAGGLQSGRHEFLNASFTKKDFQVDELLSGHRRGVLPQKVLEKLFQLLKGENFIFFDNKPIQVSPSLYKPKLVIEKKGNAIEAIPAPSAGLDEAPFFLKNGAVLLGNTLHPSRIAQIESFHSRPQPEYFFFTQTVPELEKKFTIDWGSTVKPELLDLEPYCELELQFHPPFTLTVVPRIYYGDSQKMAQLDDNHELLLLSRKYWPARKPDKEHQLTRHLQSELQMKLNALSTFSGNEVFHFFERARKWRTNPSRDALAQKLKSETGFDLLSNFNEARPELKVFSQSADQTHFKLQLDLLNKNNLQFNKNEVFEILNACERNEKIYWKKQFSNNLSWNVPILMPQEWFEADGSRFLEWIRKKGLRQVNAQDQNINSFDLLELHQSQFSRNFFSSELLLKEWEALSEQEFNCDAMESDLDSRLRTYQKKGVAWLRLLKKLQCGGLLADDMGLGKSFQVLSVLEKRCFETDLPSLIICPTSVLVNWQNQFRDYRPDLSFLIYHGSGRKIQKLEAADVILTSYALLRQEVDFFSKQRYQTIVLDEAQWIKNPHSQTARACFSLNANFRLATTGTPIENHPRDLWSIFRFLNLSLLGELSDFEEKLQNNANEVKNKLKPFIMKRTKEQVALDLPPKTEMIIHIDLSVEEKKLYNSFLEVSQNEALRKVEAGASMLSVLESLLRLRQLCCHASLIDPLFQAPSSKLNVFLESVGNLVEKGHKCLVFSQWTSFLNLIEAELKNHQLPYLRLDGATQNRAEIVDRFQNKKDIPVFLLSLKAGGVGLTLTEADYVFLMDPWWNPAVENQAIDRVHRIGQNKPVFAYRLICRNTIEEQILSLQQIKKHYQSLLLEEKNDQMMTRKDWIEWIKNLKGMEIH